MRALDENTTSITLPDGSVIAFGQDEDSGWWELWDVTNGDCIAEYETKLGVLIAIAEMAEQVTP